MFSALFARVFGRCAERANSGLTLPKDKAINRRQYAQYGKPRPTQQHSILDKEAAMQEPSGILRDNSEFSVTAFFTLVIMKRTRISSRKRISANAVELGRLAVCLAESGSRLEDAFLEKQLRALILRLVDRKSVV